MFAAQQKAPELKAKELILKSIEEARKTCSTPTVFTYSRPLGSSGLTLHHVLMFTGGCMGIVSVLCAIYLMIGHLRYWTTPREQTQYLRIILFVPFLTATTFLALTFYDQAGWIAEIGTYYETFAISALFLFYCAVIVKDEHNKRPVTFPNVHHKISGTFTKGGADWVKLSWFLVLQIAITRIATLVASEVLYGVTCPLSKTRANGAIAITVIQTTSTISAVIGVILMERRTCKTFLRGERPTFKLVSFKAIVGLQATQEIIFAALTATKTFFPAPPFYISYYDLSKGLPYIIFLFEMMIVAIMFLWSFSFDKYRAEVRNGTPQKQNPAIAVLSLFWPIDIFVALFSGFQSTGRALGNSPSKARRPEAYEKRRGESDTD